MRYLALDVGTRRTGVAFLDSAVGIPLPLDTIHHASEEELIVAALAVVRTRSIDRVVVGLPLLASGDEGSQAAVSRKVGSRLASSGITVEYADERYSSPTGKDGIPLRKIDGDAAAACAILSQKIDH